MGIEIERKFLVVSEAWRADVLRTIEIRQGYLSRSDDAVVRVRIADTEAFLTIKSRERGARRQEFEYAIPLDDAHALLALCRTPLVEKVRHLTPFAERVWEVDVYGGHRAGLVTAECELEDVDAKPETPPWVGAEITGDQAYRNESL